MVDVKALEEMVDRFGEARVLVIGDLMLDRFIWGKVQRISPEAPVPVVQVTRESAHLGGAANVVSNIRELGGRALPLGLIGKDGPGAEIRRLLETQAVATDGLIEVDDVRSIQKTRIIAHQQQVCRVDREDATPLSEATRLAIRQRVAALAGQSDAIIVSDYGKGVIDEDLLKRLVALPKRPYISVDPKDKNFDFYQQVDILTPNHNEAERLAEHAFSDRDSLRHAASTIFQRLQCRELLITLGEQGMALFSGKDSYIHIPTLAREVFDVSGAGDTVIATFTLAKAIGASSHEAAILANAAAGVVVAKLGTATLTVAELKTALRTMAG